MRPGKVYLLIGFWHSDGVGESDFIKLSVIWWICSDQLLSWPVEADNPYEAPALEYRDLLREPTIIWPVLTFCLYSSLMTFAPLQMTYVHLLLQAELS